MCPFSLSSACTSFHLGPASGPSLRYIPGSLPELGLVDYLNQDRERRLDDNSCLNRRDTQSIGLVWGGSDISEGSREATNQQRKLFAEMRSGSPESAQKLSGVCSGLLCQSSNPWGTLDTPWDWDWDWIPVTTVLQSWATKMPCLKQKLLQEDYPCFQGRRKYISCHNVITDFLFVVVFIFKWFIYLSICSPVSVPRLSQPPWSPARCLSDMPCLSHPRSC